MKQYAGDWYDDKREGFGIMLYLHQENYEWEWLNDKREGWGRMTYRDGTYYEAHFLIIIIIIIISQFDFKFCISN